MLTRAGRGGGAHENGQGRVRLKNFEVSGAHERRRGVLGGKAVLRLPFFLLRMFS